MSPRPAGRRPWSALPAVVLGLAALAAPHVGPPAARAADGPPAALVRWGNGIKRAFAHYPEVRGGYEEVGAIGGRCLRPGEPTPPAERHPMDPARRAARAADPAAAEAACAAALIPGPLLTASLQPQDQRIFAPLVLRVAAAPGGDAAAAIDALLAHGPLTNRSEQALVPVGPFVIEVAAPCQVGGLFAYDLYDVVLAAQQIAPELPAPARVAYSPCASLSYQWLPLAELAERAAQPRELWGLDFPEVRDRAKAQAPGR